MLVRYWFLTLAVTSSFLGSASTSTPYLGQTPLFASEGNVGREDLRKDQNVKRTPPPTVNGNIVNLKLKRLSERWGTLTLEERQKAIQEITPLVPPKYQKYVEEYFRSGAKTIPAPE